MALKTPQLTPESTPRQPSLRTPTADPTTPVNSRGAGLARGITSRRGAWLTLLIALLVAGGLIGGLRGIEQTAGSSADLPTTSESHVVSVLEQQFPGADKAPALLVWERADGGALTAADLAAATSQGATVAGSVEAPPVPPTESQDGRAAMAPVLIDANRPNTEIATTIKAMRASVAANAVPGVSTYVTGGPAFGADVASAFDGANFTLLAITIGIVALLLLLTYRSPTLWLVPLIVVAFADQVAGVLTAAAGKAWDLSFDGGIISVLVFGAGANYALLLISRYREELGKDDDHRVALRRAWAGTAPAILASNLTVVLSLLALALAVVPSTSGLGVASAIGLLVALAFGLLVLPAALAVVGRQVFWPFVPRPGQPRADHGVWARIAAFGIKRAAVVAVVAVALLGVFAAGLAGSHFGLSSTQKFRVAAESQTGFTVLADHFPAGEAAPAVVVTRSDSAPAVTSAASAVDGVVRVTRDGGTSTGLTRLSVVTNSGPGTDASDQTIEDLRTAVHAIPGADAQVGGPAAELVDQKA
ncbi:MAG: MMPL family transporter, partial [Dermatophilaceae bacterium]